MQPEFAVSFEGRLSGELEQAGVKVHQLGQVRARKLWTVWAARRRLRALLSERPFDAVVCHMSWPMAVFGRVVKGTKSRLVFWAHDAFIGRHWLERWASRVPPDLVIGNSLFTQGTVAQLFPHAPCNVIYYPVLLSQPGQDGSSREAARKELGASQETVVIIQVSRMEAWKGHHLHLEALSRLKDNPRWICWMAGGAQRPLEQAYQREVQQKAADLGIAERVRFLGQRSDVFRLLSAADVFSQPNMGPEPFGIVFIEALSAGLPVVTTAMGGPKEIINDSCGLIVPPQEPELLAEALGKLIDSAALRRTLGQNGPQRARELCDPGKRIPQLCEALERIARN